MSQVLGPRLCTIHTTLGRGAGWAGRQWGVHPAHGTHLNMAMSKLSSRILVKSR